MAFCIVSIFILLSLQGGSCLSPHEAIHGKEKVSDLHFFFHEVQHGDNPTAIEVSRGNETSPTLFGSTVVMDDLLLEGPEPNSSMVGNLQGFYSLTGRKRRSLIMSADLEFTSGEFNGSSISILSRNLVLEACQELAVVGGRGKFRFARGVAMLKTIFVAFTARNAIVEYNVTVMHYEMN